MGATVACGHSMMNCIEIMFHTTSFPFQIAIPTPSGESLNKKKFKSFQEKRRKKVMSEIPLTSLITSNLQSRSHLFKNHVKFPFSSINKYVQAPSRTVATNNYSSKPSLLTIPNSINRNVFSSFSSATLPRMYFAS